MLFNELLETLKDWDILPTYTLDPWPRDQPPLTLSEEEVRLLVDDAVVHQPKIILNRPHGPSKEIDLLTLLLSIGTLDKDPKDEWVGRKISRLEEYIIEKAIHHAQSRTTTSGEAVVFGLSADPPTTDHLAMTRHLLHVYPRLHLIPNSVSTLKDKRTRAEDKLDMLFTMLAEEGVDFERCRLERLEIDRDPPSRMIGTLSLLILMGAWDTKLTLALGLDGLTKFNRWYKWRQYAPLCHIKFYPRPGEILDAEKLDVLNEMIKEAGIHVIFVEKTAEDCERLQHLLSQVKSDIEIVLEPIETTNESSTKTREHYQDPDRSETRPPNIHPKVDEIIRERELYGYIAPHTTPQSRL